MSNKNKIDCLKNWMRSSKSIMHNIHHEKGFSEKREFLTKK